MESFPTHRAKRNSHTYQQDKHLNTGMAFGVPYMTIDPKEYTPERVAQLLAESNEKGRYNRRAFYLP